MSEKPLEPHCPECDALAAEKPSVSRRHFIQSVGGTAVTLVGLEAVAPTGPGAQVSAFPPAGNLPRTPKPAELMVLELYSSLSENQRRQVVMGWDQGAAANALPMRLRMYNASLGRRIGDVYTPAQQELISRILRSISSGEDGYRQLTRAGTYDGSHSLQNCGSHIFGDPTGTDQFCWVFSGHHLTVRCDGNSQAKSAFGGPMYYGHSPDGYSQRNIFNYQTRSVRNLYDALNEQQRTRAVLNGSPGELMPSVVLRRQGFPGLPASELTADQRRLVETVMRDVLSPYRREDADEAMEILRRNGGLERIHIAFYRDPEGNNNDARWHFWRLEGPGFVWNYRILPHVHTYVNIAMQSTVARPAARG